MGAWGKIAKLRATLAGQLREGQKLEVRIEVTLAGVSEDG